MAMKDVKRSKPQTGAKPAPKSGFRVRYEPPTLEEAIFAAQGMSDHPATQIEMVASLMGLSEEEVRPRVLAQAGQRGAGQQVVLTTRNGTQRSVVVQRKTPPRRIVSVPRAGQGW
jgi:hypothetical protein